MPGEPLRPRSGPWLQTSRLWYGCSFRNIFSTLLVFRSTVTVVSACCSLNGTSKRVTHLERHSALPSLSLDRDMRDVGPSEDEAWG